MKLRMAPSTDRLVKSYSETLPQAVLLCGPQGIGLHTLAEYMARQNGQLFEVIVPEVKTSTSMPVITVERIRQLYASTRSFLDGAHFVIIDDADYMNTSAQNALLKLLEEPNQSIHFILTSHSQDKLLPTIRSRLQPMVVAPISQLESRRLLAAAGVKDTLDEQRLLFVAEGLPAELARLAANQADFKAFAERVQVARQFVEGSVYQRLVLVQTLKTDRSSTLTLLETVLMLLRKSLQASADRSTALRIDKIMQASDAIRANGNVKLHLSQAVL